MVHKDIVLFPVAGSCVIGSETEMASPRNYYTHGPFPCTKKNGENDSQGIVKDDLEYTTEYSGASTDFFKRSNANATQMKQTSC